MRATWVGLILSFPGVSFRGRPVYVVARRTDKLLLRPPVRR